MDTMANLHRRLNRKLLLCRLQCKRCPTFFCINFTKDTGIKVIPVYGAMGTLVGKLVASKSNPQADVLFGGAPSAYIESSRARSFNAL